MALFDIMSRPIVSIGPDTTVLAAATLARQNRIHHLLVMAEDRLAGVLCVCDLHRAAPTDRVATCMATPVETISVNEDAEGAAVKMREKHVGCLPVTAGGLLLGILTADDLRRAGVSLDAMGRRECEACGSALHVRAPRHDPDGALCLYCRERSVESEEDVEVGGAG